MRLSESTKTAIMGNKDLIAFCDKNGIDTNKLKACNIEKMNNTYFFVLSKKNPPKSELEIPLDKDIATQPDVILLMKYQRNDFEFETTEMTKRVLAM